MNELHKQSNSLSNTWQNEEFTFLSGKRPSEIDKTTKMMNQSLVVTREEKTPSLSPERVAHPNTQPQQQSATTCNPQDSAGTFPLPHSREGTTQVTKHLEPKEVVESVDKETLLMLENAVANGDFQTVKSMFNEMSSNRRRIALCSFTPNHQASLMALAAFWGHENIILETAVATEKQTQSVNA